MLLGHVGLAVGSFFFFFLSLLEFLDDFGNHFLLLLERHSRESQQRVLKGHVARVDCQLIEHVATVLELLVVRIVLAELWNCLAVARLCLVVLVLSKINASQRELTDGLVDAVASTLLGSKFVVLDSFSSVATGEIEVTNGVVNLVEVFLVAVISGHALECLDLAVDVVALEYGTLLDACVELGAVG